MFWGAKKILKKLLLSWKKIERVCLMKEGSQEEAEASRQLGQKEMKTRCLSRTCRLTSVVEAAKDLERVLRRGRTKVS